MVHLSTQNTQFDGKYPVLFCLSYVFKLDLLMNKEISTVRSFYVLVLNLTPL